MEDKKVLFKFSLRRLCCNSCDGSDCPPFDERDNITGVIVEVDGKIQVEDDEGNQIPYLQIFSE